MENLGGRNTRKTSESSYHNVLRHSWKDVKQGKKEIPIDNTNKEQSKVKDVIDSLYNIQNKINKIGKKLNINEKENALILKVKNYLDSDIYTRKDFEKYTQSLVPEMYKDRSDRQEGNSKDRGAKTASNQEIHGDIKHEAPENPSSSPTKSTRQGQKVTFTQLPVAHRVGKDELTSDPRFKAYVEFRLRANQEENTRLQQTLDTAKEERDNLQNQLVEAWKKRSKLGKGLESHSLKGIPDEQVNDAQSLVTRLKGQLVEAITEHEDLLKQLDELSEGRKSLEHDQQTISRNTNQVMSVSKKAEISTKENALLTTIADLMRELITAQKNLDQLQKQRSACSESQPGTSLEEHQRTQAELKVWDLQISHYKNHLLFDLLKRKLRQNKASINRILGEREKITPLETDEEGNVHAENKKIGKIPSSADQHENLNASAYTELVKLYQKARSWRNGLLRCKYELLRIYDPKEAIWSVDQHERLNDIELDSAGRHQFRLALVSSDFRPDGGREGLQDLFPAGLQEALGKWNTTLQKGDFHRVEEKVINLDKIHHGLEEVKRSLSQNLEESQALKDMLSSSVENNQKSTDLLGHVRKLEERVSKTIHLIDESIKAIPEEKERVRKNLEALEKGDLVKAQELLDDLSAKMPKDHPVFPWYMRSPYITDKWTYTSSFPGACTLDVTKTLMHDLGMAAEKISDFQLAKVLKLSQEGSAYLYAVPKALKMFKASEKYSPISLETIQELEDILGKGKRSVLTSIRNEAGYSHAIMVDAIEQDPQTDLKFVCIRDSIPGPDGSHSYKVTIEDFQRFWDKASAVPTKALDRSQRQRAKKIKKDYDRIHQKLPEHY